MAVKITDVIITPKGLEPNWQHIKTNFSTWEDVNTLSDWRTVNHCGVASPLEVTVGETITVTVKAVDVTWGIVNEDFTTWNDLKTNNANWNAILNHH